MSKSENPYKLKLPNVRLSFAKLFVPEGFGPKKEGKPKFSATFIMDKVKDKETIKRIEDAMAAMLAEKGTAKKPAEIDDDKPFLKDGTNKKWKDKPGLGPNTVHISTASSEEDKPVVVDQAKQPITSESNRSSRIKSGDYVNAVIEIWWQNNAAGKRINANLRAVQLVKSGESLGREGIDADEEFEEVQQDDTEEI